MIRLFMLMMLCMLAGAVTASANGLPENFTAVDKLPDTFASHEAAVQGGCHFAPVMGPATDACFLFSYSEQQMNLAVYQKSDKGTYPKFAVLPINAWYGAVLSLHDVLRNGTPCFVIETNGVRGTGIGQSILLIITWDGHRFRTVAAETLDYHCAFLESEPAYEFKVRHSIRHSQKTPEIHFSYTLAKDERIIGRWKDVLRWDSSLSAFAQAKTTIKKADKLTRRIMTKMQEVRKDIAAHPFDPVKQSSDDWLGKNGLTEILIPCVK